MRKLAAAVALLSLVAVSCETHRTKADRLVENYAVVKMPAPDLSGITDNGKEVLNLYRFAADEVDKIYWKQKPSSAPSPIPRPSSMPRSTTAPGTASTASLSWKGMAPSPPGPASIRPT